MSGGGTYDFVVVGCGAAGLSAAVSHAQAARAVGRTPRIAIVERAPREERGGATRWTSSWFRITEDRRLDPAFVPRMREVSGGLADLDYCKTLEREVTETLAFLERHGDGQFDMFHGEPVDPRSSKPDAVVYAYPFGILVNARAERFYDEGKDSFDSTFEELAFEIWRHQDQKAFLIGDESTTSIEPVQAIILTDRPPVTGRTLRELAVALGLDPHALERTVAAYNAAVSPGEFNPRTFDGKAARNLTPPKSNWARTPRVAH